MADKQTPEKTEQAPKRKTSVAAVLPEDVYEKFDNYRWENRLSKSEALAKLIQAGISR